MIQTSQTLDDTIHNQARNDSDFFTNLHTILRERFHFNEFRHGQLEAITTLMQEGRLLCIQPTGHVFKEKIIPFTIATVKWRLGKKGMI